MGTHPSSPWPDYNPDRQAFSPVIIEHPTHNQPRDPGYTNATVSSADKRQFNGVTARWYHPEQASEMTE